MFPASRYITVSVGSRCTHYICRAQNDLTPSLDVKAVIPLYVQETDVRGLTPVLPDATSLTNHLSVKNDDLCASPTLVPLQEWASGGLQHFHFQYFHNMSLSAHDDWWPCNNRDVSQGFLIYKSGLTDFRGTYFHLKRRLSERSGLIGLWTFVESPPAGN